MRNRTSKHLTFLLVLVAFSLAISPVLGGKGTIRIEPHGSYYPEPVMLSSPATFNVSVMPGGDPTCYPHIFLVMTESCYNGLTGPVTVTWTTDNITATFTGPETDNSKKIPVEDPGVGYTVASLKDHLQTEEPIFWAFEAFLDEALTQQEQEFVVTLPSSDPRMLVYVLGKQGEYDGETIVCPDPPDPFDNRVPPTQPGFVIPEPATIVATAMSLFALTVYATRRRKH